MKWYHWSVEYFEDLRNINHCEFIVMKQNPENGKYILQNELRTWSDLKRRAAAANGSASSTKLSDKATPRPSRIWGGCANGCDHASLNYPRRPRRQNTQDFIGTLTAPPASNEKEDHPIASQEADATSIRKKGGVKTKSSASLTTHQRDKSNEEKRPTSIGRQSQTDEALTPESGDEYEQEDDGDSDAGSVEEDPALNNGSDADVDADSSSPLSASPEKKPSILQIPVRSRRNKLDHLSHIGRDFGGSKSGLGSPSENSDEADDSDWFDTNIHQFPKRMSIARSEVSRSALSQINEVLSSSPPKGTGRTARSTSLTRKGSLKGKKAGVGLSQRELIEESGMAAGMRADALGDVDEDVEDLKVKERKGFEEIY